MKRSSSTFIARAFMTMRGRSKGPGREGMKMGGTEGRKRREEGEEGRRIYEG